MPVSPESGQSPERSSRAAAEAQHLADRAHDALPRLAELTQDQVDAIVDAMATAAAGEAEALAAAAVAETGYGVIADKIQKNLFAARDIHRFIRSMRTVGVIRRLDQQRVVEIAEPFGVVAAIVPSTNPTSTAIYKLLIAIKARCPIVLSPHPAAAGCVNRTVALMERAGRDAGMPRGAIGCLSEVSIEATQALMTHRRVAVILATGGMGLVRAAYSAGKPAYGVGPGNAPAYIERSADVGKAVADIVTGKTFDNGLLCSSENAVVVDTAIDDAVRNSFKAEGGCFLRPEEAAALADLLVTPQRLPNPACVGRDAMTIARKAGFGVPRGTRVLLAPLDGVGRDYPLSIEKLCPVLAYYVVDDWRDGCERCKELLRYGGMGHTMAIHSRDEAVILEFGLKKPAFRIVVNTPTTLGSIGMTTGLDPSMTLGCGGWGGNITSDNISPRHLLNIKRLAYETRPAPRTGRSDGAADAVASPDGTLTGPDAMDAHSAATSDSGAHSGGLNASGLDARVVADRVDALLTKGDRAPLGGAPITPPPPESEAVPFVCEDDVRAAFRDSRRIVIGPHTIVTPAARDLAERHQVFVETDATRDGR
ncbi:MAG: aldehyde dehydrogenase family protein [Acidobacteria bacterium]|nr:aldehyde dehydrogenase family protein [Acidobacteriota bacterium]